MTDDLAPVFFETDDTTGGFLDSLISTGLQTGIQTGLGLLAGSHSSGTSDCDQRSSGDAHMTRCVPVWMAQLDQLAQAIPQLIAQGITPEQILAEAQRIAGVFSNDQIFDQSIGGRSQQIREAAKQQAAARLNSIAAQLQAYGQATGTNQTYTPGGNVLPVGAIVPGFDNTTLLLLGGGLVLLLFLRD